LRLQLTLYNPISIDASVDNVTSIMREIADPLNCKTVHRAKRPHSYSEHNPICKHTDWFDEECRNARNSYINAFRPVKEKFAV